MKQAAKKTISRSLLGGTLLIMLTLGVLLGVMGMVTYQRGMMERYQAQLENLLRLTATQIDADDLARCIESGVKSEQYERTQRYLDHIKETCDIKYVYVVKPLNTDAADNMMNVIAGVSEEERVRYADMLVQLGELTGSEYSPEVAAAYLERMDRSDEITYYANITEFGDMYTGLMPLHDSNGEPVAILSIDIENGVIRRTLLRNGVTVGVSIVVLSLVSMCFTFNWLRRRIIRPIVGLETAASNFIASSRSTQDPEKLVYERPEIRTQDEMEILSDAIAGMTEDMKRYMKNLIAETAEKERIGAELDVAAQIQADMLPEAFSPRRREFDVCASMSPAKEIGGDFYDFFLIDGDHLALVVADVSGKGIPAALFMMTACTILKTKAQSDAALSPSRLFMEANAALSEKNKEGMFVTVWLGILEISTGKLTYADAGHEKLLLYQNGAWQYLPKTTCGPALAMWEPDDFELADEKYRYRDETIVLRPGDAVFQYTDGVTEATDAHNELFGEERLLDAVNSAPSVQPEQLLPHIRARIDAFAKDAPQFDDITMLGMRYLGEQA